MGHEKQDETRELWNRVADDWKIQVGNDGDTNRQLNSDPVLWRLLGDIRGQEVLDAGCGTGYLTKKLYDCGGNATGIDFSKRMIELARQQFPMINFQIDSCMELTTISDSQFDVVVSNYVIMDVPDLESTINAFYRILKNGGRAVLVFSHPCFPQGFAESAKELGYGTYRWPFSYFEPQKCVEPPWGHFTADFIWFHRPLSDYWKAFKAAGFRVDDFEEPRVTPDRYHLAPSGETLQKFQTHPCSVAFRLSKEP